MNPDQINKQLLVVSDVRHSVQTNDGELKILDGVDLDVGNSESVAITGKSGSGKTTLLSMLAGLDSPVSGSIKLFGQEMSELNENQRALLRSGRVGFVFQSFNLLLNLTALENVSLALEVVPKSTNIRSKALEALDRVGLADRVGHLPAQLSGGEQQRVALARAIVTRPEIVLADEPTGNLDVKTGNMVVDMMFELSTEGSCSLVLVTHDLGLADRCSRQLELVDGRFL